jgi:hypothetical protein
MSVEAKNDDGMAELRRAFDALNSSFDHFVIAEGFVEESEEYRTLETAIKNAKEFAASLESHRGPSPLFKVFTMEQRDLFEKHVLPKLGNYERLFLRQVNRESREAIMSARDPLRRVHLSEVSSVSQFKFQLPYRKNTHLNMLIDHTKRLDKNVAMIRYAREKFRKTYKFSKGTANMCASIGDFDLFKYVIGRGAPFNASTFRTETRVSEKKKSATCT